MMEDLIIARINQHKEMIKKFEDLSKDKRK